MQTVRREVKDILEVHEKSKAIELVRSKLFAKSDKQKILDFNSRKLAAKALQGARKYGIKRSNSQPSIRRTDLPDHNFSADDLEVNRHVHILRTTVSTSDFYVAPRI